MGKIIDTDGGVIFGTSKFQCEEDALDGGFCIFHDKNYITDGVKLKENRKRIVERLSEKIKDSYRNNEPLFCIGYYLPDIRLADLGLSQVWDKNSPAHRTLLCYFTKSTLQSFDFSDATRFFKRISIDFENAIFLGPALFDTVNFDVAKFQNTVFHKEVSFYFSEFRNMSWKYEFSVADFIQTQFLDKADFSHTKFYGRALFKGVLFSGLTLFNECVFNSSFEFHSVIFQDSEKVLFDTEDLSFVSFVGTDITKIKFSEVSRWGKINRFKVIDERLLEWRYEPLFDWKNLLNNGKDSEKLKEYLKHRGEFQIEDYDFKKDSENRVSLIKRPEKSPKYFEMYDPKEIDIKFLEYDTKEGIVKAINNSNHPIHTFTLHGTFRPKAYAYVYEYEQRNLATTKAIYRYLRENYEYRLRYSEAGEFFIREMELNRKYKEDLERETVTKKNWFSRHFSLTALYYYLSRYGEDLRWSSLIGVSIVLLSTMFWITQSHPTLEPHFFENPTMYAEKNITISTFQGLEDIGNYTHVLRSFERAIGDFLPLVQLDSRFQQGLMDYIFKIIGGALTFGLLAIALRRRFERRFRH